MERSIGVTVTGAEAKALEKEFRKKTDNDAELEKLMLPTTAVKPGETWKLELKATSRLFATSRSVRPGDARRRCCSS